MRRESKSKQEAERQGKARLCNAMAPEAENQYQLKWQRPWLLQLQDDCIGWINTMRNPWHSTLSLSLPTQPALCHTPLPPENKGSEQTNLHWTSFSPGVHSACTQTNCGSMSIYQLGFYFYTRHIYQRWAYLQTNTTALCICQITLRETLGCNFIPLLRLDLRTTAAQLQTA